MAFLRPAIHGSDGFNEAILKGVSGVIGDQMERAGASQ